MINRGKQRMRLGAALLAGALSLTACGATFPEAPASIGEDYPTGGVPVSVAWPSDWLEGFVGESEAVGGSVVGLRLEYVDDQWVWRVRSPDPGLDIFGDSVTEPDRGREALIDASTLRLIKKHHVTLTEAELGSIGVNYYEAAQLSGEVYPSPRIIGLQRQLENGHLVWEITTYATDTGAVSTVTVDGSG